jgi:hypothetical protein
MSQILRDARPEVAEQPPPVFVDRTGRRRRITILAGVGLGAGFLIGLTLIIVGLFIDSSVPLPSWPAGGGQVQHSPVADRPEPSRTPDRPDPSPTPGTARTGGATATAVPPGASATTAPPPAHTSNPPARNENRRASPAGSPQRGKPDDPPGKQQ